MAFRVGDKVRVIDEEVRGVIRQILPKRVVIYTDFGFEMHYTPGELVVDNALELEHTVLEVQEILAEKESPPCEKKKPKGPLKSRNKRLVEVDLHIEKLVEHPRALTHTQMLELQKSKAIEKLEEALEKGIPKLVFIHGVGQGVLRAELHAIFRRYADLTYCDASYAHYGYGATEVAILGKQNLR